MEVDHFKGLHSHHLHIEQAKEEEEKEGGRGGGHGRGARRDRHTLCNVVEIHQNFCLTFLLFHFSKNVSIWYNPSLIVYFSFSSHIIERLMS